MPRNAEVIRQWQILRDLEASRRMTIDDLAERTGVTTRTIRRDLSALQEAGFPLYDEAIDGRKYWILEAKAFKRLDDTAFTLAELSALYFSRTLLECLAATPFKQDVAAAFDKLAGALTPGMRQFLDRLPLVVQAKGAAPRDRVEDVKTERAHIAKLLDATVHNRRATMKYFSMSSGREKDYVIEPYRLVYSPNGLYLLAFVPEYRDLRTFYVERIRALSLHEERFTPGEEGADAAMAHSIGMTEGPPEHIEIAFDAKTAPYVLERLVHASQTHEERPDGGIVVSLDVCNDWPLRSWILSHGAGAKVLAPATLAAQIRDEIERAAARYGV
jgi:predicted DNA-binding transcriptional regulator YafY